MGSQSEMTAFTRQSEQADRELARVMARITYGDVLIGMEASVDLLQVTMSFRFEDGEWEYVTIGIDPDYCGDVCPDCGREPELAEVDGKFYVWCVACGPIEWLRAVTEIDDVTYILGWPPAEDEDGEDDANS